MKQVWGFQDIIEYLWKTKKVNKTTYEELIEEEIKVAPKGARYIGEFLQTLPPNTFINKSATGVGATTMALLSEEKYIIAVPYKALANNKKQWCDKKDTEILVVQSGVSNEEIANFTGNKILVVFDSLWRLTEHLKNRKTFRLMIDEVHVVLTSASFRGKGMNTVLKHFKNFKDFVLITATPTPILYGLDEFKGVKKLKIEWQNKKKINFERDVVTFKDEYSLDEKLRLISKQHLEGDIESNAYFFINSVYSIISVVKALKELNLVTPDKVNLIVSETNKSKIKVQLGMSYDIGLPPTDSSTAKKLNFITSTAFEGSDFYDKNGKIYVVSDGARSHTKIDILTQLHQIAGRIRDSKLNDTIQIITIPNSVLEFETDREKFETKILADYRNEEDCYKAYQNFLKDNKKNKFVCERRSIEMQRDAEVNPYNYIDDKGNVRMNKLYVSCQLHDWAVLNQSFVYEINKQGKKILADGDNCGITFTNRKVKLPPKAIGKAMLGKQYDFREMMKMYIKARNQESITSTMEIVNGTYCEDDKLSVQIENIEPMIPQAYRILKPEGIKNLNYSKTKIRKAIDEKAPLNNMAKYMKLKLSWYSNGEIKERLQKFYDKTNPKLKAKAIDIHKYYIADDRKRMVDGKRVNGKQIIKCKRK